MKTSKRVKKAKPVKPQPMSAGKKALLAGAGFAAASAAGYLAYRKLKRKKK